MHVALRADSIFWEGHRIGQLHICSPGLPALRRLVGDADGRGGFGEIPSVDVANATGPDARAETHHDIAAGHHRRGAGHARLGGRLVLFLAKEETAALLLSTPLPLVVVLHRVRPNRIQYLV